VETDRKHRKRDLYEKMRQEKRKGSEGEEKGRRESPMTVAIRWTNVDDPRKSGRFQLKAGAEKEMRGKVERECIWFLFQRTTTAAPP